MKNSMALMGLVLFMVMNPAWALRCGNRLVTPGDHAITVLHKCGEPSYANRYIEYRAVRLRSPGLEFERFVPVEVEEWIYDFGRNRLMQLLYFENGRLVAIEILGYGYGGE